jgi:hypothetical protein
MPLRLAAIAQALGAGCNAGDAALAIKDLRSPGDVVAAIVYTSGTSAATAKPGQA